MQATLKQVKCIKFIENVLNLHFEGFNTEEAQDFIKTHLKNATNEYNKPTEKQIKCAYAICKKNNIKCNCKTRKEYIEFIREHASDNTYIR